MRFGNERNNIEFNTEFLEDVVKTGTKLLSKGIELGKALLGSNNYKVNPTTGEVELIGNFSKQNLERVNVITFKDEKGEQAIEFLKLVIAPGTHSAIITDFTTNKKRFEEIEMDDLIDFLEEKEFKDKKEKNEFIFGKILKKDINFVNTLYPFLILNSGEKESYTAEEVLSTINNLKKDIEDKNELEKYRNEEKESVIVEPSVSEIISPKTESSEQETFIEDEVPVVKKPTKVKVVRRK